MSTAIAHDILSPLPVPRPRGAARGHLRLVPTPSARGRSGDGSQFRSARARRVEPARHLRLTRRGRLALTTTTSLVVALVAWSMLGLLGPAGASSSIVVEEGSTLSEIAAQELPEVPLSQAITSIQRANSLSTTSVAAGQQLVIPGR
ncbi:LysM peptidoglycan-binding domain-containing protein [Serinicoccus marinus]|uniref:LysM peptidoglycan-binding domain-containing protein n=1 Tax=Serinicoccus marinus TaxID=247333 RepID=UPI0003B4AD0D|nr:LysM peptidoglycan-binding domain-containing protein [Serinicoccus marinus]